MTCPLIDRRTERKAASHAALADAALSLARERGLDGFTIDDVARLAGTSRRTFFNHFTSKEEAVVEVARAQIGRVLRLVDGFDDIGDGAVLVDRGIRALLDPSTVEVLRVLIGLSARFPTLVPALQAVQAEAVDRFAETAARYLAHAAPVLSYAFPGAVVTVVGAVYTGRLRVREIDGPGEAPAGGPALSLAELVAQLLSLFPAAPADRAACIQAPSSAHGAVTSSSGPSSAV
jgi:AcrR family transcriptional regulator